MQVLWNKLEIAVDTEKTKEVLGAATVVTKIMPMNQARMVVVTGGPGAGKTTLVEHLSSLGYGTVSEAALQIIRAKNAELGVDAQRQWRAKNPLRFQHLILQRQVELESHACSSGSGLVFCDRGLGDILAYADFYQVELPEDMLNLIRSRCYDRIFVLETPSEFRERPETGRQSDYHKSVKLFSLLISAYESLGYQPIVIPEGSLELRTRRVVDALAENTES